MEKGAVRKDWGGRVAVALAYPNYYRTGMSNLGFQVVYHLLNSNSGLVAERVFLPGRRDAVRLAPSSRGLLLLQRVRDESHRFAIEYQRALRRKLGLQSILEELPGIGPGKRRALLRGMGSLRSVREASVRDLCSVPGISLRDAETVHGFFRAAADAALGEEGAG